jgi:hypothetical protein
LTTSTTHNKLYEEWIKRERRINKKSYCKKGEKKNPKKSTK